MRNATSYFVTELRLPALRDPRLWALGVIYLGYSAGAYGVQLWLPQLSLPIGHYDIECYAPVRALTICWTGAEGDKSAIGNWVYRDRMRKVL